MEYDKFDQDFDHLILLDSLNKNTAENVVGVYRLLLNTSVNKTRGFYSSSEYNLDKLIKTERKILELGRSCIDKQHRGGVALHMMWNGLAQYVIDNNVEVLFGVASFHGVDIKLKSLNCDICFKSFTDKSGLNRHISDVHEKKKPLLNCDNCFKSFTRMSSLNRHISDVREKKSKRLTCIQCQKTFALKCGLKNHVEKIHIEKKHDEIKSYQCPVCESRFPNKWRLNSHVLHVHENIRPYQCDICGYKYPSQGKLNHHKETIHDKKKRFFCHQCPSSFYFNNAFKHIQ